MSEPRRDPPPYEDDDASDFGAKLKVRLAIAAALVGLALAAIPLLDSLTGKKDSAADNGAGNIVSSAGLAATPPTPASAPTASAPVASSQPAGTAPTGPDVSQTPGMTATPPLSLPNAVNPPPAVAPASNQAPTHHNMVAVPTAPISAAPARDTARAAKMPAAPLPAGTPPYRAPGTATLVQPPLPAQAPAVQPIEPQAAAAARPSGASMGYNVQLGLFNSLENAQKLISELKSKGIDVQSETRVHLAPFRTRAEAEQAMAKLRAMGYAPMLSVPGGGQ
ncbi:MAG: SPOR domain-containing protein [Paludibacterium sp.]|uniref:SPOR domain-containing protein n=1 Tax=Paludibacterium sp. TaxID=1917523 RepID=UPI0025D364B6|nr:SPOR domain-containing protein [Paludibacterium sp.]MBV8047163.1 SPOR domain-containing protein [Paludibacterium sp.]MBV8649762.1 SPOR domain-containing protein [Paludibacterium sp.]